MLVDQIQSCRFARVLQLLACFLFVITLACKGFMLML